ncbi:MAG: SpoIIE family protein phosphatase [Paludibacteraceae bacterium]|nr:SpoIIE family protein phosphatase [Paludibacteraceae bacterium]
MINNIEKTLYEENELNANKFVSFALLGVGIVQLLFFLLVKGFDYMNYDIFDCVFPVLLVFSIIPACVTLYKKNVLQKTKYALAFNFLIITAFLDLCFSYYVVLMILCPLFLSARYCDKFFTIWVSITLLVSLFLSSSLGYYLENHVEVFYKLHCVGLNFWHYESYWLYLKSHFVVKMISYLLFVFLAVENTKNSLKIMNKQVEETQKIMMAKSELTMAAEIQRQSFPDVSKLNLNKHIDLFSLIIPAKETAGDFYDVFWMGPDKLAFLVADVSDKGLPAAMFMMSTKNTIHSICLSHSDLGEILTLTNSLISKDNVDCMFVTVWMAIYDVKTGCGSYVNAGHNPPVLIDKNKNMSFVECEPQPFLGLPGVVYTSHFFHLFQNETLVLYTDGVTDSENKNGERFGTNGLLKSVSGSFDSAKMLCENVRNNVSSFSNGVDQFDDITIMTIKRNEVLTYLFVDEMEVEATSANVGKVLDWLDEQVKKSCLDDKDKMLVMTAIDDVLSNIVEHAYPDGEKGLFSVKTVFSDLYVRIMFEDHGIAFNPLTMEDPDLNNHERIGGLGIYLVKNIMDEVYYERFNDINRLIIVKKCKES